MHSPNHSTRPADGKPSKAAGHETPNATPTSTSSAGCTGTTHPTPLQPRTPQPDRLQASIPNNNCADQSRITRVQDPGSRPLRGHHLVGDARGDHGVDHLPVSVAFRLAAPALQPLRHRGQVPHHRPVDVRQVRRIAPNMVWTISRVAIHVHEATTRQGGPRISRQQHRRLG